MSKGNPKKEKGDAAGAAVEETADQPQRPNMASSDVAVPSSLLPIPTDEMIQEYEEEQRRRASGEESNSAMNNDGGFELFGIPGNMLLCFGVLGIAVIIGTVLAVIFYDPEAGVPLPEYPTLGPSISMPPTTAPTSLSEMIPSTTTSPTIAENTSPPPSLRSTPTPTALPTPGDV